MRIYMYITASMPRLKSIGLSRSLHGDLTWRGVHSNGQAVVKDLTCTGSRPNDCYIRPEYLLPLLLLDFSAALDCVDHTIQSPATTIRFHCLNFTLDLLISCLKV